MFIIAVGEAPASDGTMAIVGAAQIFGRRALVVTPIQGRFNSSLFFWQTKDSFKGDSYVC